MVSHEGIMCGQSEGKETQRRIIKWLLKRKSMSMDRVSEGAFNRVNQSINGRQMHFILNLNT